MKSKNVWLAVLLLCVSGLVAQAEMKVTTAPVSADYTGGVADQDIQSQNVGTNYRASAGMLQRSNGNINRIDLPFTRFDLSSVAGRDLSGAIFSVTAFGAFSTTVQTNRTFDVLGLIDTGTSTAVNGDRWDASLLTWTLASTASPAGWGWLTWGAGGTYGNYSMNLSRWQVLGSITFSLPYPIGTPVTVVSNPATLNLDSFLAADTNKLVTILFAPRDPSVCWNVYYTADNATSDSVLPTLTFPNALPLGASNPQPANGASTTNLNLSQLSWKTFGVVKYDVYFGKLGDPNELIATVNVTSGSSDVSATIPAGKLPLSVPQTYEWFVNGYGYPASDPNHTGEPNQIIPSPVWTFYTSAIPTLVSSPAKQNAFVGETATFTAVFDSLTPLTSTKWYKEMGATDQEMTSPKATITTTSVGNQYTSTMTINSIVAGDDAEYYCVVGNTGGSATSAAARLSVKRMLAHWALDGNANDELTTYNGTLSGEPNFVTDGTRQVLVFDGVNDSVSLPAGFSDFTPGMTISVWAKPSASANWARFIDIGNVDNSGTTPVYSDIIFLSRNAMTTGLSLVVYAGTVGTTITANNAITLNEWQMFTATMAESGSVVLYKNGLPVQSGGTINPMPTLITRTSNFIGKSNWTTDALYNGSMDDIVIFNYAKTADNVADMYAAVVGNFCRNRPTYDYSNNCKVDLADFATFAATWLECGLYPACP